MQKNLRYRYTEYISKVGASMSKFFIEDLFIQGKKVLMRVDFNEPLEADSTILNKTRIIAALPSIQYVLDQGGSLILMSHLGRPDNGFDPSLSLAPIAPVLSGLINRPVAMAPDCVGSSVKKKVDQMKAGDVLLLENLRFHRAEEHPEEDPGFAKELATYGDCYVDDAFGAAHRKHSSTYTITQYFPGKAAAGYLMEKEIRFLGQLVSNPKHPFYAIIGGKKISTKIGEIRALLPLVDRLLIGGAMAYTFLKAKGIAIGDSFVEEDFIPLAKTILSEQGNKIVLPVDLCIAKECDEEARATFIDLSKGIPPGFQGLDIGPQTLALFAGILQDAATILWNGPLGVYEFSQFARGTHKLSKVIASLKVVSIVGGGDLITALEHEESLSRMTFVSTGGGAMLEYIEYGTLPGVDALSEKTICDDKKHSF